MKAETKSTFFERIKKFIEDGYRSLLHKTRGKKKNPTVLNDKVLDKIVSLYKKGLSGREIHLALNHWCITYNYKTVSHSSVKRVIAAPEFKNKYNVFF